jgi:hypothetical protein
MRHSFAGGFQGLRLLQKGCFYGGGGYFTI